MPRLIHAATLPVVLCLSLGALPARAALVQDPTPPLTLDLGHASALGSVAYSADGTVVLSLDALNEIRWREAATGKTRFVKTLPQAAKELRAAPDGSFFTATADDVLRWWEAPSKDAPLKLRGSFSVETPKPSQVEGQPEGTFQQTDLALKWFGLSPDGKSIATLMIERKMVGPKYSSGGKITQSAVVRLWNPDGTLRRALEAIPYTSVPPLAAFTADGKLTVVFPDHSVKWFDAISGEKAKEWAPPAEAAQKATDGAAERAAESERRMQQLPQGLRDRIPARGGASDRLAAELLLPERKFGTVTALSSDGTRLLSATLQGFKVWDLTTGTAQLLENTIRLSRMQAVFSPDGTRIAMAGGSGLWVWDSAGPAKGRVSVPLGDITSVAFAPDGQSIVAGDERAQARIWSLAPGSGADPKTVLAGFFQPWEQITATADGMIFSTGDATAVLPSKGPLHWQTMDPITTPVQPPAAVRQTVTALAASRDGTLLAEAVYYAPYFASLEDKGVPKGELRVRNLATNTILWRVADSGRGSLNDMVWLPDNTLLLGKRGASMSVRFVPESLGGFQRRDGKTGERLPLDVEWGTTGNRSEPGGIVYLQVAADGSHVLVGGINGPIILDLKTKAVTGFLTGSYSGISAPFGSRNHTAYRAPVYAISADGHWMASGGGAGSIALWDLTKEHKSYSGSDLLLRERADDGKGADALAFAPDGTLIVGFGDGSVRAWKPEWTKGATPAWETAATGFGVKTLGLDHTGTRMWMSDARGELKERDVASGTLQSTLRLMPPNASPAADATRPYAWARWTAAGALQKSTP